VTRDRPSLRSREPVDFMQLAHCGRKRPTMAGFLLTTDSRDAHTMKAALTVWNGRVSPLFDVSREAVILTIENGAVAARRRESIDAPTAALKIDRVMELGVETLICGAISEPLHRELAGRGVKVLGFVAGEIDEIIEAFLTGNMPTPEFSMPGCRGRQTRLRRGWESERGKGCGLRRRR